MEENKRSIRRLASVFVIFAFLLSVLIVGVEELFFEHSTEKVAIENAVKKRMRESILFRVFYRNPKRNYIL